MSEKKWTSEDMTAAIERALQTMEGVALELYRRGREPLLEELEAVKRERDEALVRCETLRELADAAAYEQGLAQRRMMDAQRERDEARAEVERLSRLLKMAEDEAIAADDHGRREARRADAAEADAERLGAERAEALAIVDVLRGVGCNEDGDGPCGVCRKCAYRHGAEAMREACAVRAQRYLGLLIVEGAKTAEAIRALPIPEEP